jgi:hypothetical protein
MRKGRKSRKNSDEEGQETVTRDEEKQEGL